MLSGTAGRRRGSSRAVALSFLLLTVAVLTEVPVSTAGGGETGVAAKITVYVGYYDNHHHLAGEPKPNPWQGSPRVDFVGIKDKPSQGAGWDTSAVRVRNNTAHAINGVTVEVKIGKRLFSLWGPRLVPPNGDLIVAQMGYETFDGSDVNPAGCYSCSAKLCKTDRLTTIPVVTVTIAGTALVYLDTTQILNTHGWDSAGCPYLGPGERRNESEPWTLLAPPAPGRP